MAAPPPQAAPPALPAAEEVTQPTDLQIEYTPIECKPLLAFWLAACLPCTQHALVSLAEASWSRPACACGACRAHCRRPLQRPPARLPLRPLPAADLGQPMVATFTQFLIRCALGCCSAGPACAREDESGQPAGGAGPSTKGSAGSACCCLLTPAFQLCPCACRVRNIRNESALSMAATRMQVGPWAGLRRPAGAECRPRGLGARSTSLHPASPAPTVPPLPPATCAVPEPVRPPSPCHSLPPPRSHCASVLVRRAGGGRPAVCRLQPRAGAGLCSPLLGCNPGRGCAIGSRASLWLRAVSGRAGRASPCPSLFNVPPPTVRSSSQCSANGPPLVGAGARAGMMGWARGTP